MLIIGIACTGTRARHDEQRWRILVTRGISLMNINQRVSTFCISIASSRINVAAWHKRQSGAHQHQHQRHRQAHRTRGMYVAAWRAQISKIAASKRGAA